MTPLTLEEPLHFSNNPYIVSHLVFKTSLHELIRAMIKISFDLQANKMSEMLNKLFSVTKLIIGSVCREKKMNFGVW